MQRYFIDSTDKQNVSVTDEQYHHIVKVMRMKTGDKVNLVLANNKAGIATIQNITEDTVYFNWETDETVDKELPIDVTIAVGLLKGDKLDWLVQKATELGMHALVPLAMERSVVKWEDKKQEKKIHRLQKIAIEAAEQSHRTHKPTILPLYTVSELAKTMNNYHHVLIAYEESAKSQEFSQLSQTIANLNKNEKVLVVFGCEGGISESEIEKLTQAGGLLCGLGPRILRAETAPLYVLSALSFALELS